MGRCFLFFLLLSRAALADGVGRKCVSGCDTSDTSSTTTPTSPSAPDQQLTPAQEAMVHQMGQSAHDLGLSLGDALHKSLFDPSEEREQATQLNNQAIAAAGRQDWKSAISLTEQALKLQPDDEELQKNLAILHAEDFNSQALSSERRNDWKGALALVDQALTFSPQNQAIQANRQQIIQQVAAEEAREHARRQEEIAQHLSGALKLSGDQAGGDSGNSLGLKLGAATDPDPGLRPKGNAFFGLGGRTRTEVAPASNSSVVDLHDAGTLSVDPARLQAVGGAGVHQGAPDRAPVPPPEQGSSGRNASNPLGLKFGQSATSQGTPAREQSHPTMVAAVRGSAPKELAAAASAQARLCAGNSDPDEIIADMNRMAQALHWSGAKRKQFSQVLEGLRVSLNLSSSPESIGQAWAHLKSRVPSQALLAEVQSGQGPTFPGAGLQTSYNDCGIFALASAVGLPYGVVAARAGEMIRKARWHNSAERGNPQGTIEKCGLNGGEVALLAESFGQAEVVPGGDFKKTLADGRVILVALWSGSQRIGGHEVVLTKVFIHDGTIWYAMMDSNQGPTRRLYLTDEELQILLREPGVAYRPDQTSLAR